MHVTNVSTGLPRFPRAADQGWRRRLTVLFIKTAKLCATRSRQSAKLLTEANIPVVPRLAAGVGQQVLFDHGAAAKTVVHAEEVLHSGDGKTDDSGFSRKPVPCRTASDNDSLGWWYR